MAEMEDEIWSLKQQISNIKAQNENNEQNLLNQVAGHKIVKILLTLGERLVA